MANNGKTKEKFEIEKGKIEELVALRNQKLTERNNVSGIGVEKREAIRAINAEIQTLNRELSEIGRGLITKKEQLDADLARITSNKNNKGRKVIINYELISGEKGKIHVIDSNKGRVNGIINEMNLTIMLLEYFKENVKIEEEGIVSKFKIDEEAVAKMTLEERLVYFNDLCIQISNPKYVKDPAKSITLGKRYCLVNECDVDIYIECHNRYGETSIELERQRNNAIGLQAALNFANQKIKIADVEVGTSSFHIDWDLVSSFETLEEKAEYFNNFAIKIASSPKTEPKRIPLGKSSVTINACDELVFMQCYNEYNKLQKAIKARKKPSYTIDWDYVNTLESAEQRAEYFEDLCGKIDAVEKFKTVDIPFRNHKFTVNEVDAEVFFQAMKEFEKNYLQAYKEKQEAEKARIEEEKRQEEARIAEEKRKEEERLAEEQRQEAARIEAERQKREAEEAEKRRIEQEKIEAAIAEANRLAEEKRQEDERIAQLEALAKENDGKDATAEQIIAETLQAIENGTKTKSSQEKRDDLDLDDLDELLFINDGSSGEYEEDKEEIKETTQTGDAKAALEELDGLNPDGEDEIDFFDDDFDYEEEAAEKAEDVSKEDDITAIAEELGGTVINDGDLQIMDLSIEEVDAAKEKEATEDENNADKNAQRRSFLKDLFKGKKGKNKVEDTAEQAVINEGITEQDTIEITDNEILKVLESRNYSGNISEAKLYLTKKRLFLYLMDLIEDQKITNKVQVITKRHTAEIDAKYEGMYTFIVNKYEKLEDKYERIANDKYHNLKTGAVASLAGLSLIVILALTIGKDLFASNETAAAIDILNKEANLEFEEDKMDSASYNKISAVNAIIEEAADELKSSEEEDELIEESSIEESSLGNITIPYEGTSYIYNGAHATEAFNINPSGLIISEEDASDEIKREVETNKAPLLDYVR